MTEEDVNGKVYDVYKEFGGVFEDNSHTLTEVGPGDVCLIRCGESHGLDNPHDEPLEIMALVLNLA